MGIVESVYSKKVTGFHLLFKRVMLSVVWTRDNRRAMNGSQEFSLKAI